VTVDRVRIVPFDPELPSAFAAADLVVCQAGYNTIGEVIASGVAAVCVPAPRMADDQHLRARSAAARHPLIRVSAADPDALFEGMLSALCEPLRERQPPAVPDGAQRAAAEILSLMEST
jgi:UDP-N-acetylglucosamine--N-acetylmuramyl-(pentapeptide) pyrophosphoryl-undecaprenol N-acetylglucosamine transferase